MSVNLQYRQLQRPVNPLKSTDNILNIVYRFLIYMLPGNEVSKKETLQPAQSKQSLLIGNHTTTSSVAASQDIPVTQNHAAPHLQTYAAKAILSRMARGATGGDPSDTRHLPTIASALVSVGLDSSAHVVRHLAPEVGGHLPPDSNASSPSSTLNKHSTLNPHQQSSASDVYGSSRSHARNGGGGGDESTIGTPPVDTNRFSLLLTPTVIDDHFDQYKTYSRQTTSASNYSSSSRIDSQPTSSRPRNLVTSTATDSKAEGPILPEFSYDRPTPQWRPTNDTSPDSGVSVGDDTRGPSRGGLSLIQRRQTLPGGPAYAITISPPSRGSGTSERPKENGILPGLKPMSSIGGPSSGPGPSTASVRPTPLHIPAVAMFRSTLRKTPNMGSMPDVTTEPATSSTMPREEVHLLSLRRREELRREREEQERRRQQEIVLRFGDIKVFFTSHPM